jgi:hypothetical protein
MMILRRISLIAALLVMSLFVHSGASAFLNDFEAQPLGTSAEDIPLVGATMGSPFIPYDWTVQDAGTDYVLLQDHILKGNACNAALEIEMEAPITAVNFLFGADASVLTVKVDGWNGTPGPGTLVFSNDYTGTDMGSPSGKREGTVSITSLPIDWLIIYSPGGCLAIDNLDLPGIGPLLLPGPDLIPIPDTARGGCINEDTPVYWAPRLDARTDTVLTAGKTVWAIGPDVSGEFFKIAFAGHYLWVPSNVIGPNMDSLWQGAPLPMEPVD